MLSAEIDENLRKLEQWRDSVLSSSRFVENHPMASVQVGDALLRRPLPAWLYQRWLNSTELIPVALKEEEIHLVQTFYERLESLVEVREQGDRTPPSKNVDAVRAEIQKILSQGNPLRTKSRNYPIEPENLT